VYRGKSGGSAERDVMTVTHSTKQIMGAKCVVVDDRVWAHGKLTEKTYDYYAQDKKGNVWSFGEDSKEYKNGKVSTAGSWEAGKNGAKPGIIIGRAAPLRKTRPRGLGDAGGDECCAEDTRSCGRVKKCEGGKTTTSALSTSC
jgi:hypothetical protein